VPEYFYQTAGADMVVDMVVAEVFMAAAEVLVAASVVLVEVTVAIEDKVVKSRKCVGTF